jgi:hypothetical protein
MMVKTRWVSYALHVVMHSCPDPLAHDEAACNLQVQKIWSLAKKYDATSQRTLGVLTKVGVLQLGIIDYHMH